MWEYSFAGVPLPFNLQPLGFGAGCILYTDIVFVKAAPVTVNPVTGASEAHALYPLPADPALSGTACFSQWFGNDSQVASPLKMVLSDAIQITLGKPGSRPFQAQVLTLDGARGDATDVGSIICTHETGPILQFTGEMN